MKEDNENIIPASLAIIAMRDSGYKNTAYALAELIDNAQQAEARCIEVLCFEEEQYNKKRSSRHMAEIAVLDDGHGMDSKDLRKALQFGNGTRLKDRSGIGRFGMGLPNASISQANRIDIWSWQNGTENALHSYLDIEEIQNGKTDIIPPPNPDPVPMKWRNLSNNIDKTGTLVVWSKLDLNRLTWKTAKPTLSHTRQLIGRIYRHFLENDSLKIRTVSVNNGKIQINEEACPIDPLYLIPSNLVPAPFNDEPMFKAFGDPFSCEIQFEGMGYEVKIRLSVAKEVTIDKAGGRDRGSTKYGQHAANNIGISVVRAKRELMLDTAWCIGYDPRERWWGAEVDFPPELDEVFGVTNNKQAAIHFSELANIEWRQLAEEGEDFHDVVERLQGDGDPKGWLLELSNTLQKNLKLLREDIKEQGKKGRSTREERHGKVDDPTSTVNKRWKERSEKIPLEGEDTPKTEQDFENIFNDLTGEKNYSEKNAKEIIKLIREKDLKVIFLESRFPDNYNLFDVENKGDLTEVTFNQNHPAFDSIFGTLNTIDEDIDDLTDKEILDRLEKSINASKIIFAAWARYERELGLDKAGKIAKIRQDWGRLAAKFLEEDDDAEL